VYEHYSFMVDQEKAVVNRRRLSCAAGQPFVDYTGQSTANTGCLAAGSVDEPCVVAR